MDFINIPKKYRPIPFWSWNEKLNEKETSRQIGIMDSAGIGGYFMHARGGLQTEYMGEQWFDNIAVGVSEAKRLGMSAWAYDENGWPSGSGNGVVNAKGVKYQQKYLRMEKGERQTDTTITNCSGLHFFYEVNPFYVDVLDGEVIKAFIDEIYQPYYDKFANDIEGFFTDEPQISRRGIPWSFILPEEYKKAYDDDLLSHLIELFEPVGDYKTTRFRFWKLVTDLFSKNYMKQIYDWCEKHNLKLTGHLLLEENVLCQLTSNGACMPHYEYLHIPGMDWLGRNIFHCLTHHQVSSVAHQLGKKQILSETFALCGHNVSFNELKRIFEWQMVRGITLLCPHLQGYSLRGIRKRDYPPAMYYQQPWWEDYKIFIDAMSRVGMLLTEGRAEYDTLLIHPQSTIWTMFDNDENEGIAEYAAKFDEIIKQLESKHILFHLGDETIMERHAVIEGDTLVIGTQKYKTVILPPHTILFDSTEKLLDEFVKNGGEIKTADKIEDNLIVDNPDITYTKREFDGFTMHYFVNSTEKTQKAKIAKKGNLLDIITGELKPFSGKCELEPYGSAVLIENGAELAEAENKALEILDTSGEWNILSSTDNAITLDFCDYYFDGILQEKNGYVLNIASRVNKLKKKVAIHQDYKVKSEYLPSKLYLVCETPDIFKISVNGAKIDKTDCGCYVDNSFRKIDITEYFKLGENVISFDCIFRQSDRVYENIERSAVFEREKNKLTFDMEIEPIYLLGDFSVKTTGEFIGLERDAERYSGEFIIEKPKSKIVLKDIQKQGYPFFCGSMTFNKAFDLAHTNYKICFDKKGVNVIKVRANGVERTILWGKPELDMSEFLVNGSNEIEITIINNLRNLLGPHHLQEGESYNTSPRSFYKEPNVWKKKSNNDWNNEYCFVMTGIF